MLKQILALFLLAGCASGSGGVGKPLHQFPTKQQLVQHVTPLRAPLGLQVIEPEAWQLELPQLDPNSPVHALLPVLTPRAVPTAALNCAAHEIGRVLLNAPDKVVSSAATRFILARCGSGAPAASIQTWMVTVDPGVSDAALVDQLKAKLAAATKVEAAEAGAAIVRDQNKAIFVVNYVRPLLSIISANLLIGTAPTFRLAGRVLFDTDMVTAVINAGDSSFATCELDPGVALPQFAATCPVAAADESAWMQVLASRRGSVIGDEVYQAIVLRRADAAAIYRPQRAGAAQLVSDSATFTTNVMHTLNELRQRIGLGVLKLASDQSQLASQVAPSLFAALEQGESRSNGAADLLALGLMAGWDVSGGMIRDCRFVTNLSIESLDSGRWLANMLELPIGRAILLDPDTKALALGAVVQQQPAAIAAVALGYEFFEPEASPGARAVQLAERLARVRNARGLGRTVMVEKVPGLKEQLAEIHRGEVDPESALNTVLHRVVDAAGRNVQGFIWDTQNLDAIEFPDTLLRKGDLTIAAGVTYYKAPGAAWGQYCVLFVVIDVPPASLEA